MWLRSGMHPKQSRCFKQCSHRKNISNFECLFFNYEENILTISELINTSHKRLTSAISNCLALNSRSNVATFESRCGRNSFSVGRAKDFRKFNSSIPLLTIQVHRCPYHVASSLSLPKRLQSCTHDSTRSLI